MGGDLGFAAFGAAASPWLDGMIAASTALVGDDDSLIAGSSEQELDLGNDTILYRLREDIERFLITDINNPAGSAQAHSEILLMQDEVPADIADEWNTNYNHLPSGGNILYMDGHVQFVRYLGDFPICGSFAGMQAALN